MPFIYDPTAGGSVSSEEWTRSSDWLTLPTLGSSEQKFVGLYAIYESGSNFASLSAAGNYTVDWGDGVVENYNTGVQSYHTYDYSAISNSTLSTRGYKQVIVTVSPQAGQNLTNINLQRKHNQATLSNYRPPWLDISLNSPNLTSFNIGGTTLDLSLLERANIGTVGTLTSFSFRGCNLLQSVSLFNTASVTSFSGVFLNCYSLRTVPLFNTASGTNFGGMFSACYSLRTVPLFNTASGTNFTDMFLNCQSMQSVPLFNTVSGTNFTTMFAGCVSLPIVPLFNTTSGTNFSSMFSINVSLSRGALSGTRYAISYSGCKLSREEIVSIFNNLGTAAGAQTITITGNWGTSSLTAGDLAIATGKGWTVAT